MPVYISILRGINVSGQKSIRMADLKALYESLGFKAVQTYIQSGNVLFETSKGDGQALAAKIEKAIAKQYGFEVPVLLRSAAELNALIAANPYSERRDIDTNRLYLTFLAEVPAKEALERTKACNFPPDEFSIAGKEVYLHVPHSYGNTKLSNTFFENKLKVKATTRNWKTVLQLAELAG